MFGLNNLKDGVSIDLQAVLSHSVVSDFLWPTPWTVTHQTPLSMGILQARILEWVVMPSSRGSSQSKDWTQISGLMHCRWVLYHLNHQGRPRILKWVVYPFSRGISQPRSWTRVSCIAGGLFTSWATRGKTARRGMCGWGYSIASFWSL